MAELLYSITLDVTGVPNKEATNCVSTRELFRKQLLKDLLSRGNLIPQSYLSIYLSIYLSNQYQ